MKEAAGEANMTIITIVLIAVVLGIGTIVVTNVMNNSNRSSCCVSNGGEWRGGHCCTPGNASCSTDEISTTCG